MTVNTVQFDFIAKDMGLAAALAHINSEAKSLGLTMDSIDIFPSGKKGKDARIGLQATAKM